MVQGEADRNAKTGFETSLQLIESIGLRQQRRARDEHGNHSVCCALAGGVKHFQIGPPFDGPPRQIETGMNLAVQREIGEKQIDMFGDVERGHGFIRRGGRDRLVSFGLKKGLGKNTNLLFVLDDQHDRHGLNCPGC